MQALSFPAAVILAASGAVAPTPAEKPVKWEYAEMVYRSVPARAERKDADGKVLAEAMPGTVTVRWATGADETTFKGWGEMATKLNLKLKVDASPTVQKLQVLNGLGAEGWEVLSYQTNGVSTGAAPEGRGAANNPFGTQRGPGGPTVGALSGGTLVFKRRVP